MKSLKALIALAFAGASPSAFAIDLAGDEAAELRSRADGLISERTRNPGWDGGTTRLAPSGDVRLNQNQSDVKMPRQGDVKAKPKSAKPSMTESATKKAKRTIEDMPGALVRKR